jgi:chemotaxis-related protein WspD
MSNSQNHSQNNGHSPGTVAERSLLDRDIPFDYLNEWTQALAEPTHSPSTTLQQDSLKIGSAKETLSVMIFRLGNERFALPVSVLQEITRPCPIHTLPHRSNDLFLGLVNNRGEVLLCVSLTNLLGVEMPIDPTYSRINLKRMIVVARQESRWIFPVDEVHRVYRCHSNEVQDAPVVVTKAYKAYTQGIIDWQHEKVNYLDADRLFNTLDHRIL